MTDEIAAGRKTDSTDGRLERVAAGLEKHFRDCEKVLGDCSDTVKRHGSYWEQDMRNIAAYMKVSAQIAGQIGRLETIKNRNSKAQ